MPLWMDAIGVLCIGIVQGYLFMFALRRLLPPITPSHDWLNKTSVMTIIASLGVTRVIGASSAVLPQGSMIGPYGLGLFIGLVMNNGIILWLDTRQRP
jgi:hypothetical protein